MNTIYANDSNVMLHTVIVCRNDLYYMVIPTYYLDWFFMNILNTKHKNGFAYNVFTKKEIVFIKVIIILQYWLPYEYI